MGFPEKIPQEAGSNETSGTCFSVWLVVSVFVFFGSFRIFYFLKVDKL